MHRGHERKGRTLNNDKKAHECDARMQLKEQMPGSKKIIVTWQLLFRITIILAEGLNTKY
jgi:hypothetical protein